MIIKIELPDYNENDGFVSQWEDGFEIKVTNINNYIEIKANKEGLISLAKQFLYLAEDHFPPDYHLHYDHLNSLEDGSVHLVVSKTGND